MWRLTTRSVIKIKKDCYQLLTELEGRSVLNEEEFQTRSWGNPRVSNLRLTSITMPSIMVVDTDDYLNDYVYISECQTRN